MTTAPRLPNFIIAGAPRSATTWLYMLADRHPEIAMAKPVRPEPKFFLVDELYKLGIEHYARTWFEGLQARIVGEKSTNYLENPKVAERMRRAVPEVQLVFMLRNPVERAYSNYLWTRQNGLELESFERALELEVERERNLPEQLKYSRPYSYFSRGLYARHLAPFFAIFPREQILVVRQEDVTSDPHSVAAQFHAFLGVEPMPKLASGLGIVNSAIPGDHLSAPPKIMEELAERYREPNRALQRLLGNDFVSWTY